MTENVIKGKVAYWSDLISDAYDVIKSLAQNIDTYPTITNAYDLQQNGTTYTLASGSGVTLTGKVDNTKLKQVNSTTVKSQLESFLESRGLDNKNDPLVSGSKLTMTAKGIINFYNNVAIFIRARIHVYKSSITGTTSILIYDDDSSVTYSTPDINDTTPQTFNLSNAELRNGYYRFIDTYNRMTSNKNKAIISYSSSSSSSSSSCSSSCSSSSSCSCCSSSSYIVYMLIS